mmetsp:Transcript_47332/g.110571  ORF Transcript_47332/g.110571 Transcript_47332/m.110571 type:complete len:110 (+) Transcript_47332:602-931(+)
MSALLDPVPTASSLMHLQPLLVSSLSTLHQTRSAVDIMRVGAVHLSPAVVTVSPASAMLPWQLCILFSTLAGALHKQCEAQESQVWQGASPHRVLTACGRQQVCLKQTA